MVSRSCCRWVLGQRSTSPHRGAYLSRLGLGGSDVFPLDPDMPRDAEAACTATHPGSLAQLRDQKVFGQCGHCRQGCGRHPCTCGRRCTHRYTTSPVISTLPSGRLRSSSAFGPIARSRCAVWQDSAITASWNAPVCSDLSDRESSCP